MGYLPGSHRAGVRKFQNIFFGDDDDALLDRPGFAGVEPVFVEVPRGGVAFHAGLTVHMAKPNVGATDRPVHTVIMFADGCTRGSSAFHVSVDRDGIEVGAPIAGACTPLVWPRDENDFPAPPPPVPGHLHGFAAPGTFPTTNNR